LFAACTRPAEDTAAKSATPATPAIATVNGKPISSEFFDEFLTAATGQPAAKATPEQKSQLLDQLLNMSVAAQSAETDGLANDSAVKTRLELLRLQVLAEAASEKFMKAHPSTEAEIKAEYDTQVAAMPKEYRARHILVDSKETGRVGDPRAGRPEVTLQNSHRRNQRTSQRCQGRRTRLVPARPHGEAVLRRRACAR
jgi:hypothetical protein